MEKELIEEVRAQQIPGEYGKPIPLELCYRELGITGPARHRVGRKTVSQTLATKAVHTLCTKQTFEKKPFKLPPGARTTFHVAFSADGSRVASCHGDHNVYVCDVGTGKVIQTLTGHPRTPWCVTFHPTQNDILASGCLAGHIRVWDLKGGSELLVTDSGTVIASLAFHPTVRLLAIATFNEIIFWDWGLPHPLARCSTQNVKEKVRLVRFDRLGQNLITGITNFPSSPNKETGVRGFQYNPYFRPNILSRSQNRAPPVTSFRPAGRGSFYAYSRRPETQQSNPANNNSEQQARSSAASDGTVTSSNTTERQERFQESYRQLVHHYQDLVSNYQQFLRSRIPRLLETSRIIREEPDVYVPQVELNGDFESPVSSSDNSLDGDGTGAVSLDISPNPVIIPEVVVEPADIVQINAPMIIEEEVIPPEPMSRLEDLETRLIEHMETANAQVEISVPVQEPVPMSVIVPSTSTASTSNTDPGPSETGLRNIEALAQNIIEMQNLCSRARRDAPVAVETNHIRELQNIRRHLEVLQDQTRELQSSIRATLSSLARGSVDVLNAQELHAGPIDAEVSLDTANVNPAAPQSSDATNEETSSISSTIAEPPGSSRSSSTSSAADGSNVFPQNRSAVSINVESAPILPGPSGRLSPTSSFSRVPSAFVMQYGLPDDTNPAPAEEPVAGPSRQMMQPRGLEGIGRRLVREFHVFHGPTRGDAEHSRNCPFGARDTSRPPARMRCLSEMGENPTLTIWPSSETEDGATRRNLRSVNGSQDQAQSAERRSTSGRNPNANDLNSFLLNYPIPHYQQLMNSGPYWVNNALGVNIFLNMRRVNESVFDRLTSETTEGDGSLSGSIEQWQRSFIGGLGLVPPSIREGRRQQFRRARRGQNVICQIVHGHGRMFTLRPSEWDEFRSNFLSPNSPSELGSLPWNSPYLQGSSSESPLSLGNNLIRRCSVRIGDELVPIYTHGEGGPIPNASEIRDTFIPNVFVFPIGLLVEGESLSGGPQTLGIFWPPISRDEEEELREYRRSEALIPVWAEERVSPLAQQCLYRIEYDHQQLRIAIDQHTIVTFIQPGLILLDAVTTLANLPRPRPASGTVFVNHLSPLFDALERLFGHRMRPGPPLSPTPSSSAPRTNSNSNPSASTARSFEGIAFRMSTVMQPTLFGNAGSQPGGRQVSWVPVPVRPTSSRSSSDASSLSSASTSSDNIQLQTLNPELYSRSTIQRFEERARSNPRRLISFSTSEAQNSAPGEPSVSQRERNARSLVTRRSMANTNLARRHGFPFPSEQNASSSDTAASPIQVASLPRSRGRPNNGNGNTEGNAAGPSSTSASTRRFIRFAVDTATAEVLRHHPSPSSIDARSLNQSMQRAIESRIERVLNERGNRGNPFGAVDPSDEVEMRVNMYPLWSGRYNTSTSGTQTTQSFIRSSTDASTSTSANTNSTGVGPSNGTRARARFLTSRRRPRYESGDDSDEEPMPPSRVPRLSSNNNQIHDETSRTSVNSNTINSDDGSLSSSTDNLQQESLSSRRSVSVMPSVDVRVARRQRTPIIQPRVLIPGVSDETFGGAARTEPFGPRGFTDRNNDTSGDGSRSRLQDSIAPAAPVAGTSTHFQRDQQQESFPGSRSNPHRLWPALPPYQPSDLAGRVSRFSDYLPEILITPRFRNPNIMQVDAPNSTYVSSRIQKWDFSEFYIPDITKRDEAIVVNECSLHSDACVDISSDSEFLAVIQPADSGSFSAVGLYSLKDETLGEILHIYHLDHNAVSTSISPSCDYIIVGYAGRGPFYRFVNPSRTIGQIFSLARSPNELKLVPVKKLETEGQTALMNINCMHFVPVPGYGIIYGTTTGELVLLS